ncbi:MAG: T9SS type A sorting domain-containing protein [Bacteroidia bacterium]
MKSVLTSFKATSGFLHLFLWGIFVQFSLPFHHLMAQSDLNMTVTVPTYVTICDTARTFYFEVTNVTNTSATAVFVTARLDVGQEYQAGSLVGTGITEFNITDLRNPVFQLPNFSNGNQNLSIKVFSSCDLINAGGLSGGQNLQMEADLDYITNGTNKNQHVISLDYSKKYAALSILSITNQNYTGFLGGTYTRTVTVKNGGYGRVSSFQVTAAHNNQISVTAVSGVGAWTSWTVGSQMETYTLSNFAGIGNGDNYFDLNEVITFTETIALNQCTSNAVTTNYTVGWGCNSQVCQTSIGTASTNINGQPPILTFTPTPTNITCLNTVYTQNLAIQNTGTGAALNVVVDLFRGSDNVNGNTIMEQPTWAARINPTTIQYRVGTGAFTPIAAAQTFPTNTSCYTSATNKVRVIIPSIAAGTTVTLRFEVENGCPVNCDNTQYYAAGWMYNANYLDNCNKTYTKANTVGLGSKVLAMNIVGDGPTDLSDGDVATFTFNLQNYQNTLPTVGGVASATGFTAPGFIEVKYTLPTGMIWAGGTGNLSYLRANGATLSPVSGSLIYNTAANTITIRYANSVFASMDKSTFSLMGVSIDCATATNSTVFVQMELAYYNSGACTPVNKFCASAQVALHTCGATPCPDGLQAKRFNIMRTTYGLADNDNNCQADGFGSLDTANIRYNYAMHGDTLLVTYLGKVFRSVDSVAFDYGYAKLMMNTGAAYLTEIPASLTIHRGASTYNATVSATRVGTDFGYNLSAFALGSAVPVGFKYDNGDSIVFKAKFYVNQNPTALAAVKDYFVDNEFYLSRVSAIPPTANKRSCEKFYSKYFLVKYVTFTNSIRSFSVNNCNTVDVVGDYFLMLGSTGTTNAEGVNIFRREFRPLCVYDSLTYTMPTGYNYVSARLTYYRSNGTGLFATNANVAISPASVNGNVLKFDIKGLFDGGTLPISDEGHHIVYTIRLQPDCGVVSGSALQDNFKMTQSPAAGSTTPILSTVNVQNNITYTSTNLSLTSSIAHVVSIIKDVIWEFDLSDISAVSVFANSFVGFSSPSGMLVPTQLLDVTTNTVINPVGDVYQLGNISTNHHYRLFVTNNGCGLDSMIVSSGWTCSAYPATMSGYSCQLKNLTLSVMKDPNTSEIQILNGTSTTVLDPCLPNTFKVKLLSSKIAYVYDPRVSVIFPVGMNYISGSAQILYPLSDSTLAGGGWRTIDDPSLISASSNGTLQTWIMNNVPQEPRFLQRGFPGVINEDSAEFWIRFNVDLTCDYTSGSRMQYRATGKNLCGAQLPTIFDASNKLRVVGAPTAYDPGLATKVQLKTPMCTAKTLRARAVIRNSSSTPTGTNDFYYCKIPQGYWYGGNFTVVHNPAGAFPSTTPTQSATFTDTTLKWQLPSGFQSLTDSIVFEFDINIPADVYECGTGEIESRMIVRSNIGCPATGSCEMGTEIAYAAANFSVEKPTFQLQNLNVLSVAGGYNVSFQVVNTSAHTYNLPLYIDFFEDTDNSNDDTGPDVWIDSIKVTTMVAPNGSIAVSKFVPTSSIATTFYVKLVGSEDYHSAHENCTCNPAIALRLANAGVLPADELKLEGMAGAKENILAFSINKGHNIAQFELEKQQQGTNTWTSLQTEKCQESTFDSKRITWEDTNPMTKEVYRGVIVGVDGMKNYSNQVVLVRDYVESIIRAYPNPANDKINLIISIPGEESARLQVFDTAGQLKTNEVIALENGLISLELPSSKWATGFYFIKVQYGNVVRTHKILVIHE